MQLNIPDLYALTPGQISQLIAMLQGFAGLTATNTSPNTPVVP